MSRGPIPPGEVSLQIGQRSRMHRPHRDRGARAARGCRTSTLAGRPRAGGEPHPPGAGRDTTLLPNWERWTRAANRRVRGVQPRVGPRNPLCTVATRPRLGEGEHADSLRAAAHLEDALHEGESVRSTDLSSCSSSWGDVGCIAPDVASTWLRNGSDTDAIDSRTGANPRSIASACRRIGARARSIASCWRRNCSPRRPSGSTCRVVVSALDRGPTRFPPTGARRAPLDAPGTTAVSVLVSSMVGSEIDHRIVISAPSSPRSTKTLSRKRPVRPASRWASWLRSIPTDSATCACVRWRSLRISANPNPRSDADRRTILRSVIIEPQSKE